MPKTKLVNWQGQMKIAPAHFVQTENFFINEINDTRAVFQSKNEYGLLPLTEDSPEARIQIREHISNHEVYAFDRMLNLSHNHWGISFQKNTITA